MRIAPRSSFLAFLDAVLERRIPLAAGSFLLLVDLWSKDLAYTVLSPGEGRRAIVGDVVGFVCRENPGGAFGLLSGLPASVVVPVMAVLNLAAMVAVPLLLNRVVPAVPLRSAGITLIVAGAAGNLVDRLFRGAVIDFIDVRPVAAFSWPTFNLADVFVVAGAGLAMLAALLRGPRCIAIRDRAGPLPPGAGGPLSRAEAPPPPAVRQEEDQEGQMTRVTRKELLVRTLARSQRGMTLIEIMVVVTILALMATGISISVVKVLNKAKVDTARSQIHTFDTALDLYRAEEGDYPSQAEGLNALTSRGADGSCYLKKCELPKDPWKNDYYYRYPGTRNPDSYDVCSRGPDKSEGTEDDICN